MTGWVLLSIVLTGGIFLWGRAAAVRSQQALTDQRERDREVSSRADQQHSWASRGDVRGVYGTEGAELMRAITPKPAIIPPGDAIEVAAVVHTTAELDAMLTKRPPCWRYASFVSVAVQRRDAVAARVRDARMGFARPNGEALSTEFETGLFFTERLSELYELIGDIDGFMLSPAFREVFGDPHDENSADAGGVVHAANRLMDYHDCLLDLAERSRGVRVPYGCGDLQRDFGALTVLPIDGFGTFIEDFTERVAEMGDVARYATGDVQLDNVELGVSCDDELLGRISTQLQQLARAG
ncbi:MAG: hypothetical protein ACR2JI_04755 [Mycobacterium sp.]